MIGTYINLIVLAVAIAYFFSIEIRQIKASGGEYLQSFWNYFDLITLIMCSLVIIFDLSNNPDATRGFATVSVVILWIKLFYYLRIFN